MTTRLAWVLAALGLLAYLALGFLALEGSVGHDGLLCEWGIDMDGAGDGISGCG